jgi:hypothetical protein
MDGLSSRRRTVCQDLGVRTHIRRCIYETTAPEPQPGFQGESGGSARIIDTVVVYDTGFNKAAKFKQMMPIAPVACQARCIEA